MVWLQQLGGAAVRRWLELVDNVNREKACKDVEFRLKTGNRDRWLNVSASLLERIADEELGVIISIWRDVTARKNAEMELLEHREHLEQLVGQRTAELKLEIIERKRAAAALRESEEKYRTMMDSMKDAAYICCPRFRIEYMNPRMKEMVGRDATGEICHKAIYGKNEKCPWCVYGQVLEGKHVEHEWADPKNNRYYSVVDSPIHHSDGSVSKLTLFRDVTEQKAIESRLRQASKMESIGTMAGGIAHDFNNILYIISGNAELAMDDIPEWDPARANLKAIKSSALRAAGIVKQLLDFSRKPIVQEIGPIGAVEVVKDALEFLRSTIPATVEIRTRFPETETTILGDSAQISQAMMNLCINASQAMEEKGGILDVAVENIVIHDVARDNYSDTPPGDYLKITVGDTGTGIEPHVQDKIFDPYFTTKEIGQGSGMGLAVVHGIVKNHKGAISVESRPGKGTVFTVLFPAIAKMRGKAPAPSATISQGRGESILFIDDETGIVRMWGQMLERLGYSVETRTNPVEALELFRSRPEAFDLVVTDMTMPKMTGLQLSQELKKIRRDIPVILCTGHSALIDEETAGQTDIQGYVQKPIARKDIAKTIRDVLDDKNRC